MGNLAQAVVRVDAIKRRSKAVLFQLKQALQGESEAAQTQTMLRELRALIRERARWRTRIATTLAHHPEVVEALVEREIARLEAQHLYRLRNQIGVPHEPEETPESRALQKALEDLFPDFFSTLPKRHRPTARTVKWGTLAPLARALSKHQALNRLRREAATLRLAQLSQATELIEGGRS